MPPGALLGALAMSGALLPWGLAFAAGLFAGFVLMMMFDTMFA